MNHQQEIHQLNDSHFREVNLPQYVIVVVVGHNVSRIGLYGTVNKFVVIGVGSDEVEMVSRIDPHYMLTLHKSVDDGLGKLGIEVSAQDFFIFKKNLACYTQGILSIQDRLPHPTIHAVVCHTLDEAIGVKNDTHYLRFYIFLCFLFSQPLMKVRFVNLVKTFLVKFARFPHLFSEFVDFLGIIVSNELLDIIQFLVTLNARKQIQQIELGRIENCR